MSKSNKTHVVLKSAFDRMQRSNPKFSIRALATKVGVSHVFMMKLLKGQVAIPDKKLPILIKVLALDDLALAELKDAIIMDAIDEKLRAFPSPGKRKKLASEQFDEFPAKHISVLMHWYDLPILDLLTCKDEVKTAEAMAKRLGIAAEEVERSLEKLKSLGLAQEDKNGWSKTSQKIRFPTSVPSEVTKNYYNQVLGRASIELNNSKPERFAQRSITNLCIAVDPSKVQEAKEKLQQFLYDLASDLADGECEEVYFLTTSLFPVTK